MRKSTFIVIGLAVGIVVVGAIWFLKSPDAPVTPGPSSPSENQASLLKENLASIVRNYRKVIVLLEDEKSLGERQRKAATLVGRYLFQENQKLLKIGLDGKIGLGN